MVNDLRSEMQERIDMLNNELKEIRKVLHSFQSESDSHRLAERLARTSADLAKVVASLRETTHWANRLERVSTKFVNDLKKSL